MSALTEKAKIIETKRGEMKSFYEALPRDEGGELKGITPEQVIEFRQRNDELATIQQEYTALKTMVDGAAENEAALKSLREPQLTFPHPKGGPEEPGTGEVKRLSDLFMESPVYRQRAADPESLKSDSLKMRPMETTVKGGSLKTLLSSTAGYPPFVPRNNTVIYTPQRRPVVADLIPQVDTDVPGVRYIEETLFTNTAAAVAEGAAKPEAALQFTERFLGMTKIAVTLPVTEEQMADVPQLRAILDDRLRLMIKLEEERELLQGNPSGSNTAEFVGFLNKPGVQTIPKGAMDDFTAFLTAVTQIESTIGFANVSGAVAHPLDWLAMRTKQNSTGRFIMGSPDEQVTPNLFGVTIIPTIAEPQNSILLGDFATYSQILRREQITFRVGYVGNQFLTNQLTIVVEERLVLVILRPVAFGIVTGTF